MNHTLAAFTALLLAPLAALHAAEPTRTLRDVHAPLWVGRPPSDAVSGLVRLENGELRHYDYGIDPTPELRSHPGFLPTSYVFSRDQGLTWETQKVPKAPDDSHGYRPHCLKIFVTEGRVLPHNYCYRRERFPKE